MQLSTDGIIIKETDLAEADRTVGILTRECGLIYAYANGAKRVKSKLAAASSLLCYSNFQLFYHKDRYTVDEASTINLFYPIREDIDKLSLSTYLCELTRSLAPQGDRAEDFLRLLLNTLFFLEKEKRSRTFLKAVYELRILSMAGYMPDLVGCRDCGAFEGEQMYLLVDDGAILCEECKGRHPERVKAPLSPGMLGALRHIIYSDLDKLFSFSLPEESMEYLGKLIERYMHIITERTYLSLEFYHSLSGLTTTEGNDHEPIL